MSKAPVDRRKTLFFKGKAKQSQPVNISASPLLELFKKSDGHKHTSTSNRLRLKHDLSDRKDSDNAVITPRNQLLSLFSGQKTPSSAPSSKVAAEEKPSTAEVLPKKAFAQSGSATSITPLKTLYETALKKAKQVGLKRFLVKSGRCNGQEERQSKDLEPSSPSIKGGGALNMALRHIATPLPEIDESAPASSEKQQVSEKSSATVLEPEVYPLEMTLSHKEKQSERYEQNTPTQLKSIYFSLRNHYMAVQSRFKFLVVLFLSLPGLMVLFLPLVLGPAIAFAMLTSSSIDITTYEVIGFFTDPRAMTALANSLIIAAVVGLLAPLTLILMSFIGLYNHIFGKVFNTLASITFIAPGIAFAVMCLAFINMFELPPSIFSLGVAHYLYVLPVAAIAISQGRKHLTPELISTAEDLYATPLMIVRHIAFPVLKPSFFRAFHLCLSLSFCDVLIGHLISEHQPMTFGAFVFYLWQVGHYEQVYIGLLIMLIMGTGFAITGMIGIKSKVTRPKNNPDTLASDRKVRRVN